MAAHHTGWHQPVTESGYKNGVEDREVLQEILADAKEKQFDILLTYMSDRIGRQEEYSFSADTVLSTGRQVLSPPYRPFSPEIPA